MNFDGPGVEYRPLTAMPPLEAVMSLAEYLDTDVATAGGALMRGTAAAKIEARQKARQAEEQRAAGYVKCGHCGAPVRPRSVCPCGEVAPGSTLTGEEANAILRRKFLDPTLAS